MDPPGSRSAAPAPAATSPPAPRCACVTATAGAGGPAAGLHDFHAVVPAPSAVAGRRCWPRCPGCTASCPRTAGITDELPGRRREPRRRLRDAGQRRARRAVPGRAAERRVRQPARVRRGLRRGSSPWPASTSARSLVPGMLHGFLNIPPSSSRSTGAGPDGRGRHHLRRRPARPRDRVRAMRGSEMSRSFPSAVDVAIVGSGPNGAAYARVLSERAPGAAIAVFEVGPALTDPPGMHVKNIADLDERLVAQRRSEGLRPHTATKEEAAYTDPTKRVVRAGTHLLPDGFQQPGEDGIPALAMSSNVGGMGAHWTCACPRPGDAERPTSCPTSTSSWTTRSGCSASPGTRSRAPYSDVVRERLAPSSTRSSGGAPGPVDAAGRARPGRRRAGVERRRRRLRRGDPRQPGGHPVPRGAGAPRAGGGRPRRGCGGPDRRDGSDHEVRARFVVVAADALRTPQLLFASGVRPPALGRYLNDQPQMVFAVRLRDIARLRRRSTTRAGTPRSSSRAASPGCPTPTRTLPRAGHAARRLPGPDRRRRRAGARHGRGARLVLRQGPAGVRPRRIRRRGTDDYGMPKPRIHYTLTERDRETSPAAGQHPARRRRARRPARRRAVGAALGRLAALSGHDPDGRGRRRDVGLRADQRGLGRRRAVRGREQRHPHPMACNPTLTSVALAIGGARDIAARLAADGAAAVSAERGDTPFRLETQATKRLESTRRFGLSC